MPVSKENLGDVVKNGLVIRCIDCQHHLTVHSLSELSQQSCPSCGCRKFKAVPLKNEFLSASPSFQATETSSSFRPSLASPDTLGNARSRAEFLMPSEIEEKEAFEDFLIVKELELGIYQINLRSLLAKEKKSVLTAGAREGVYVIRLPTVDPEDSLKNRKKKKK